MPRSSRIARARPRSPRPPRSRPRPRKLPWRSTTRSPKRASRTPARRSASGSASTPSKRVRPSPLSISRSECPPMPTVPSTTQPLVAGPQEKHHFVHEHRQVRARRPLGVLTHPFRRAVPACRRASCSPPLSLSKMRPALRVPDLEHLLHSENDHVLHEPGARAIVRGHLDAPLRIELHVLPLGEILVAKHARVGIELGQRVHFALELFPPLQRMHVEALAVRHDHELVAPAACQHVAESRRDAEPALSCQSCDGSARETISPS